jgi:hypothetical protein
VTYQKLTYLYQILIYHMSPPSLVGKGGHTLLFGAGGVGLIPANSDAQNVTSFRRWRRRLEMKLSPFAKPPSTKRVKFCMIHHRYKWGTGLSVGGSAVGRVP